MTALRSSRATIVLGLQLAATLIGALMLIRGVALVSVEAGWIVAGLLLLTAGLLVDLGTGDNDGSAPSRWNR